MATVTVNRPAPTVTVEMSKEEGLVVARLLDDLGDRGVRTRQENPWLYNLINALLVAR